MKSASRVRDLAWARAQKLRGRETKPSSEPLVRPGAVRSADGDVNANDQELLKKGRDRGQAKVDSVCSYCPSSCGNTTYMCVWASLVLVFSLASPPAL